MWDKKARRGTKEAPPGVAGVKEKAKGSEPAFSAGEQETAALAAIASVVPLKISMSSFLTPLRYGDGQFPFGLTDLQCRGTILVNEGSTQWRDYSQEIGLMKTSTARAHNHFCPQCGDELTEDHQGRGFVRHKTNRNCPLERRERDESDGQRRKTQNLRPGKTYFKEILAGILVSVVGGVLTVMVVARWRLDEKPRSSESSKSSLVADASHRDGRSTDILVQNKELRRFDGHNGSVLSLAVGPEGRFVVSGGADGTVRLWNFDSAQQIRFYDGHKAQVVGVGFSRDGKRILSGSYDKTLRLWDVDSGKELRVFQCQSTVYGISFSPDGRYALSAHGDDGVRGEQRQNDENAARLWNVETGTEIRRLKGHQEWVWSVAFSPDGRQAIGSSLDKTICLWNLMSGELIGRLRGHTSRIDSVAFAPDGLRAVSGSEDGTVRIWDLTEKKELYRLDGAKGSVQCVAVSPDGRFILAGGEDRNVHVWNIESRREVLTCEAHGKDVLCLTVSPDSRHFLSGSWDGSLRLWRLPR